MTPTPKPSVIQDRDWKTLIRMVVDYRREYRDRMTDEQIETYRLAMTHVLGEMHELKRRAKARQQKATR